MGLESKVGAEPGPQPGQGAALLRRAGRAPRKIMNKCWFIGDDRRCWMVFLMVDCFIFYRISIIIIVMLDVSKMSDVGFNSSIRSSSFPRDGAELGQQRQHFFLHVWTRTASSSPKKTAQNITSWLVVWNIFHFSKKNGNVIIPTDEARGSLWA